MSSRIVVDRQINGKHWTVYENGTVYVKGYPIIDQNGKVSSGLHTATEIEIALALHKEALTIEIEDVLYEPPSIDPPEGRIWKKIGNEIGDWVAVDPNDNENSDSIPYEEEIKTQEILLEAAKEIYTRKFKFMPRGQVIANSHMEKLSNLVLELMCSRKNKAKILESIDKIDLVWEEFKTMMRDENLEWISK